jgi:hypothetical protein
MKKKEYFIILALIIVFIICLILAYVLQKNKENFETEKNEIENPSFHVLIATMGRDNIFNMLESLKRQLKKEDYLTIVFDGPGLPNVDNVRSFVSDMKCITNVIVEEVNLGYWGHAIRNKHNQLPGDFVFHVDDDDNITEDCMDSLRETCKDRNTIYVFKYRTNDGITIWRTKDIILGEIGTPSGIIPTHLNPTSEFTYVYGGDYYFYKKLEENGNHFEYIDKVIYLIRPLEE